MKELPLPGPYLINLIYDKTPVESPKGRLVIDVYSQCYKHQVSEPLEEYRMKFLAQMYRMTKAIGYYDVVEIDESYAKYHIKEVVDVR